MATYLVIRDGKIALRLPNAVVVDGKLVVGGQSRVIDGKLADQAGCGDHVRALAKARRFAEIDPKFFAGPGVSSSGLEVVEERECSRREQDAFETATARKIARLEALLPGYTALESAYADQERYDAEFRAMMADGDNDGACPPRRPVADVDALRRQYPKAAAWILADQIVCFGAHDVKVSAYQKAKSRIEQGDDPAACLAAAEKEFSDWCLSHVD